MKNMKKHILWAITLVIAGLLITSAVSITATENITEKNIIRAVKLEEQYYEICPYQLQAVSSHKIDYVPTEMIPRTATSGTDVPILVAADEIDIENPCLLDNGGNTVIAIAEAHEDILSSTPFVRYSNDGGNTWIPEDTFLTWEIEDYVEEMPSIDFAGDNGGFGTMIPIDPVQLLTVNIDDVTDHEAGDGWGIIVWDSVEELDSCDACGVNSEFSPNLEWAKGIQERTGDRADEVTNILWISWQVDEGSLRNLWTGNSDDVVEWENTDCDVDLTTGLFFETYEYLDHESYPDGVTLLFCQLDGTDDWWEGDWYWIGGTIEGATNPDVKSDGGNCYLVFELDGGIVCWYSNDNAQSFNEVVIADNGQFPAITAYGETAVCSYTRDGDLYTSISEDGGDSWEETTQINDVSGSVVEQPNCQHVSGRYVAWTDDRNAPQIGVYFDISEIGTLPILEIGEIKGGLFKVSAIIKNTGDADATGVQWSIELTGGIILLGKSTTGTVDIPAGGEVTVQSGLIIGFGSTTITVKATIPESSDTKSKSAFVLFIYII